MGIDIFTLRVPIEVVGMAAAKTQLEELNAVGARTAATLNGNKAGAVGGVGAASVFTGPSEADLVRWRAATKAQSDAVANMGALGAAERAAGQRFQRARPEGEVAKGQRDLTAAYQNQAAVLAGLAPKQDAHAEKLEKGTKAAKAKTETLGGLWHTVKALGEAYLVFQAIDFVKDAVEKAGALHELAQKTGASVERLSVLEFAGKRAGVSVGDLEQGFRGLSLSLGNLRDGQTKTVEAFNRLGLTAKDFIGLNTDQAFELIVDRLRLLPNGLEKSEVAARLFGQSGAELIPLLDTLARDGFAKTTAEAERLHAVVSEKTAADATKLTALWGELKVAATGLALLGIHPLTLAFQSLYQVLSAGPSDTWRNTMREITGAVDGATRLATLGFFGTHLSDKYRLGGGPGLDSSAMGTPGGTRATLPGSPESPELTDEEKSAIKERARERVRLAEEAAAKHRREMLALVDDWAIERPTDLGSPFGKDMGGPMAVRKGSFVGTAKEPAAQTGWLDDFQRTVIAQGQRVQASFQGLGQGLGQSIAGGFQAAMNAGMHGGNIFKAFGKAVLQGLGSIFMQMGSELLVYGMIMLKLLPFLSNPFTSGPAAIAAGLALMAAGTVLGAIATGGGGNSGGGGAAPSLDRTTHITLTPDGAGGFKPVTPKPGDHYTIIGVNDPQAQSAIMKLQENARRRGLRG